MIFQLFPICALHISCTLRGIFQSLFSTSITYVSQLTPSTQCSNHDGSLPFQKKKGVKPDEIIFQLLSCIYHVFCKGFLVSKLRHFLPLCPSHSTSIACVSRLTPSADIRTKTDIHHFKKKRVKPEKVIFQSSLVCFSLAYSCISKVFLFPKLRHFLLLVLHFH